MLFGDWPEAMFCGFDFPVGSMGVNNPTGRGSCLQASGRVSIQPTPKRSSTMPKSGDQKVAPKGMVIFASFSQALEDLAVGVQASTMVRKPPQAMRLKSKGGFSGSHKALMRGSAITAALTVSRCSRDS